MGTKLLWTGLTIIEASNVLPKAPGLESGLAIAGGIIMVIGAVVIWISKTQ